MAVSSIGAVLVPIYPTSSADDVNHIVGHCGVSLLVAEADRQLRRVAPPEGLATVVIEAEGEGSLADLAARGRQLLAPEPDAVSRRRNRVDAGDVLTYLYTSGTTGLPKACVLTHRNFTAMGLAGRRPRAFSPRWCGCSWLWWALRRLESHPARRGSSPV